MNTTHSPRPVGRPKTKILLTMTTALLAMIGPFSIDTYLPSFPVIAVEYGVTQQMLSLSLGVYLAAFAGSTLFWGPLSDRIGRRWVILISLALYLLASLGCALASDIQGFLGWRVVQGLAASGGFITGRAMIRDTHDARGARRAMSQVMLVFAAAPAIAPVLGGLLHEQFGWRGVFWFLAGFGLLLIVLGLVIRETLVPADRQSFHPRSVLAVYAEALTHARFLRLVLCLAFAFGGLFLYIAGAPTVIYDFLGLGSQDFGLQFVPMVAGIMLGSFLSSHLAHNWSARSSISAGLALAAVATLLNLLLALSVAPQVWSVIGPLVLYAFGLSLAMPAVGVLALDCLPRNRGSASSIQGFLQMTLNAGVASLAVPLLHQQWSHFALGQLVLLAIGLGFWWVELRRLPPVSQAGFSE